MTDHTLVSETQWLAARRKLLEKEKEFSRARERLAEERRALPWVEVTKDYAFETPGGQKSLLELFGKNSQLAVYHFMFGPDWQQGCHGCSFWADSFNLIGPHLNARDATFVAVSRAPLAKLEAYKQRLGWSFDWVSSGESSFNHDFGVYFTPEEVIAPKPRYNYGSTKANAPEMPGISVFCREEARIFHTYSSYSRGIDMMNTAYQFLDLTPKGRDEQALEFSMSWLKRRDEYAR